MNYTKEEYNYLKKFESNLHRAYFSDYCLPFSKEDLENIYNIYKNKFEPNFILCRTCNNSILNLIKNVAKYFFEDKENKNKKRK